MTPAIIASGIYRDRARGTPRRPTPPIEGPRILALWLALELQATAFGKCSSGTNCGRIARVTGPLKERTTPLKTIDAVNGEDRVAVRSGDAPAAAPEQIANPT